MPRDLKPGNRKSTPAHRLPPSEAYALALERISKAKKLGSQRLELSGLKQLTHLPEEIAELKHLDTIELRGTQVKDLSPLRRLKALEQIDINYSQVNSLEPLNNLPSLRRLYAGYTQISELPALRDFSNITILDCSYTRIRDFSAIAGFVHLRALMLAHTQFSDSALLTNAVHLYRLDLRGAKITDLTPVANLRELRILNCAGTKIREANILRSMHQLVDLDLRSTRIRDVSWAAELLNLEKLDLSGTGVSDISALKGLIKLKHLDISETQVANLRPLANLTSLQNAAVTANSGWYAGLRYEETTVAENIPFDRLSELPHPASTVETINYLRRQQGLIDHTPPGYSAPTNLSQHLDLSASASTDADEDIPTGSLEPIPGVPSGLGFRLSKSGRITIAPSPAAAPFFPVRASVRNHADRLDACKALAEDLLADIRLGKFQARSDYAAGLEKYSSRLPTAPDNGNIFLADAEARTLRNLFAAEADILAAPFASRLKTLQRAHCH